MDRTVPFIRKGLIATGIVMAAAILFTACLKHNDNNAQVPVAGLMAFNLAADQSPAFITIGGNNLTPSPLGYSNYTGVYENIYTGSRTVAAYNSSQNAALASATANFVQGQYYSAFFMGFDSSYRMVISTDSLNSLAAGNAYIRYVNAIADSVNQPAVTITSGSTNIVSENAPYGTVSPFKPVAAGNISIAVKNAVNATDTSRTITVNQNGIYTILLSGVPGQTDPWKRVQVRYIPNGIIADSSK